MTDSSNTKSLEEALAELLDVDVEATTQALTELKSLGYELPAPPRTGRIWHPSPQAMATAQETVTLMDIPVHIARYVVVKAEKKQAPTSAEWLRWLFADEQKRKEELAREQRDTRNAKSWHSVAD